MEDKQNLVGRQGFIEIDMAPGKPGSATLTVQVRITDTRTVFGRAEVLVTPVAGAGQAWKAVASVRLIDAIDGAA